MHAFSRSVTARAAINRTVELLRRGFLYRAARRSELPRKAVNTRNAEVEDSKMTRLTLREGTDIVCLLDECWKGLWDTSACQRTATEIVSTLTSRVWNFVGLISASQRGSLLKTEYSTVSALSSLVSLLNKRLKCICVESLLRKLIGNDHE